MRVDFPSGTSTIWRIYRPAMAEKNTTFSYENHLPTQDHPKYKYTADCPPEVDLRLLHQRSAGQTLSACGARVPPVNYVGSYVAGMISAVSAA